ncbi:MAG TPA: O-antigen ligase family protein [Acidobacteriota bacterium]|nr:O-antigen ligase family protein [Acidobacteriota bacterium]
MVTDRRMALLAEWTGIIVVVLCSPVMLLPKMRWLWLLAVIPLSWLLRLCIKGSLFEPSPLNSLLLFLVLMIGVSLYATFDIQFSLGKVCGALLGTFVFLALTQFVNTDARLKWFTGAFLAAGTGLVFIALIGTAWWAKFGVSAQLVDLLQPRFKGLPGAEEGFNPNAIGGSLILFLPLGVTLAAHFIKRENRRGKAERLLLGAILFLLLLMGGTLLLSQSRGAWLGFCTALALFLLLKFRWMWWVGAAAGALGALLALIFKPWTGSGQLLASGLTSGAEITLQARLEIWSRAVYGIEDFAFTGMGMNAFRKVVQILYPLFTISPDVDIAHAHNQLLQTALDLGIPGLVAYIAIWAAVFRLLWRVWRQSADPLHRAIALGLTGGLIAQFVFGINDAIALGAKVGVFWWIAIALAVSLEKLDRKKVESTDKPKKKTHRAWEIPALWVLTSLLSISLVGNHPYVALAIAILGGIYLGIEATSIRERQAEQIGVLAP